MNIFIILFLFIFLNISNVLTTENVIPESVKLALTKSKNQMRVTWYTIDISSAPTILYSTEMFEPIEDSTFSSIGDVISYDTIGFDGKINTAIMSSLSASTMYFYCVGDKSSNVWSPIFNFTTNQFDAPFGQVIPFTTSFFGDMGWIEGNSLNSDVYTVDNLLSRINEIQILHHVGDIAYADKQKSHDLPGNQTIWNKFQNSISPLSSHLPYLTCPGNHDRFIDLSVYTKTWQMPVDFESDSWYSYDYNGIHFVGFSSEHDYFPLSSQHIWIENDLKQYRKSNPNGWIVMYSHRPFYCSVVWDWCSNIDVVESKKIYLWSLEDLLYRYNVDLFISGHAHSYERTLPVYKNKIMGDINSPKATVHIVVGTGGDVEGEDMVWQNLQTWTTGIRTSINGFGLLNVINSTTLNWQFIANINNTIVDEFNLTKGQFDF
ncbi:hypothetical protein ACTFIV_011161 [Dictyostelium citrinum]